MPKNQLSASEALYGFVGWLTSRPEKTVMSSTDDAAPMPTLIEQFTKTQGLPEPREGWDRWLVSMGRREGHRFGVFSLPDTS